MMKAMPTIDKNLNDYFSETVPGYGHDTNANFSRPVFARETSFTPTVGIFNRCTRLHHFHDSSQYSCAPFVSSFAMPDDEFPDFWKASLIFLSIGLAFMTFTVGTSLIGCCIRAIVKKSIFNISGSIQAIAGLFYVIGLFLYPAGWSSRRVVSLCGEDASYYMPGDCSLGWAFYLAVIATLFTFVCAFLSVYADNSTSTDKVQDKISDGKNLICLL